MRYQIRRALGPQEVSPYFSVAAMLIESALLYTIVALVFIITYARDSIVSVFLIPLVGQVQVSVGVLLG